MRLPSLLLLVAGLCSAALNAQVNMSSITTTTTDAPNTTSGALTFQNTTQAVTSFTGGGSTYYVSSLADSAYVSRNTAAAAGANTSSAWYAQAGSTTSLLGTNATSYSSLLLGNNLTRGSDNTFANGTAVDSGNIERLDFVFSGGITASSALSFAVFERGDAAVHDAFKIAVITGWNAETKTVTSYGTLTAVATGWGTTNVVAPFNYDLLRYNTNDDLTTPTSYNQTATQGIGGIFFTLSQLGVNSGTIYGYSLFGYDVPANATLTNPSSFPTTTNNQTGGGGIDLAAVNGVLFTNTPVPEPSTYALFGAGSLATLAFWRRRRRAS